MQEENNMKDIDILKEMFDKAKIEYTTKEYEGKPALYIERGYVGFSSEFSFSPDGKLLDVRAYEE